MNIKDTTAPILSARGLHHSFGQPRRCAVSISTCRQAKCLP
jgi:hypothetical protein